MSTKELPPVYDCAVEGCSYNSDTQCHAGAISITGGREAGCGTFIDISITGGLPTETAMVGACHRADCPQRPPRVPRGLDPRRARRRPGGLPDVRGRLTGLGCSGGECRGPVRGSKA